MTYSDVIQFWFEDLSPKQWWIKDQQLDLRIKQNFGKLHADASKDLLMHWRGSDQGRLAEIIVLDQFSRNMFRGEQDAFAFDAQALVLTKQAVEAGSHTRLRQDKTNFLLMPYMHSESLAEHEMGLPLFEQYGAPGTLDFELKHKSIIERFGRYPHRNQILGRESTPEEAAFLGTPGSSF